MQLFCKGRLAEGIYFNRHSAGKRFFKNKAVILLPISAISELINLCVATQILVAKQLHEPTY
jgi:hypothetical protein